MKTVKGSALNIPTAPLAVFQCFLARSARPGPLCVAQRVPNSGNEPHSGPRRTHLAIGRAFTMTAAIVLGGSSSALACPVCFGVFDAADTSMVDGTKLGILALLAITLLVQGAFAGFFLYLRQRAKRIADLDLDIEWSKLQGGASRT